MPRKSPSTPPPRPDQAASFPELTEHLRALHAWCGKPKYAALSKCSGLAPSAISGLIGKRPLTRPTQASTVRFVEACLTYAGWSPDAARPEVEVWSDTWRRLEQVEPQQAGPQQVEASRVTTGRREAVAAAGPGLLVRGRRRAGVVALVVVGVLVVIGAVVAWRGQHDAGDAGPASTPIVRCHPTTIPPAHDIRFQRTWRKVFACPNRIDADVRLSPVSDSPVISHLKLTPSWYVCWTRAETDGRSTIWYYTQGDRNAQLPRLHSWGFVDSHDVRTEVNPDPEAFRECPSRLGPPPSVSPSAVADR